MKVTSRLFPSGLRRYLLLLLLLAFTAGSPEEVRVGYAVLRADPEGSLPVAGVLFSLRNSSGVLVSEAGVGAVGLLKTGRIFVDQDGTRTGLALANPSGEGVAANLTVRDLSGNRMADGRIVLEPGQHVAQFVDELFPALPPGFAGSLTFATQPSDLGVAAVTLRLSSNAQGEPLFATLPVATLEGATAAGSQRDDLIFPHIGAGAGILSTQIILINRSPGSVRGQIEFTGTDGAPLTVELDGAAGSEFPYQLGPHGSFRGTVTRTAGVVQGYAAVTVEPGGVPPAGTAVFQFRDDAGRLVSEAGVGATAATRRARIFVDSARTRTGIAVAAIGVESTQVAFELLDRHGFTLEAAGRDLPAGGQTALFADELFPDLPAGFTGLLEIRSDRPIAPITLKLTANTRRDLVLTTLPVADLTVSNHASLLVFPQVGFGMGFSTRLILVNDDLSQTVSGTLEFRQSNGSPLTVPLSDSSGSIFDFAVPPGASRQLRPGNTARPASIIVDLVSPQGLEVVVNQGNSLSLNSAVIDSEGEFRDDFELDYESVSPEIASVDGRGRVTGNAAGFSTLVVTAGEAVETATITVAAVTAGSQGFAVTGLARDLAGRTYLAGSESHTIRLTADPSTPPEVYAGIDGVAGLRNGGRLNALFNDPAFLALNQADGSLFVSDRENNAIRRISPGLAATVETLTGGAAGNRDGSLAQARFSHPEGVALDATGSLWIADRDNHTIRRIDLVNERVETIAGLAGSSGFQDGRGEAARFSSPSGLAVEPEPLALQLQRERRGDPPPPASVIVADRDNGVLRRVREDGSVTTVGDSPVTTRRRSPSQTETPLPFDSPAAVAVDSLGRIYVSEPERDRVTVVLPSGEQVPAVQRGTLGNPVGIAVTETGELAVGVADRSLVRIAYGEPEILAPPESVGDRIVVRGRNFARDTTVVIPGVSVEDLQVEDTSTLSFTIGPVVAIQDSLLTVLNRAGVRQRPVRVFRDGTIGNPVSGFASFTPSALALELSGNVLAATSGDLSSVFRIRAGTGTASRAAGNSPGGGGDGGPAKDASLDAPRGLATDRHGSFFIADSRNHRIRRVDPDGIINTVAGAGTRGFSGDGGPALQAELGFPQGVAVDAAGNLLIADTFNHRLRRVDADGGVITTIAGNGADGFSGDNGPAPDASLSGPQSLALDRAGNLFLADTGNNRIRRVDAATGIITTVAGNGQAGFSGDGGPASAARLNFPGDIALDVDGNLLIADSFNNRVRRVDAQTGIITTVAGNGGNTDNREDGAPATMFPLFSTVGVSVDAAGNIFILEGSSSSQNFRVLRVHALTGIVTTNLVEALLAD